MAVKWLSADHIGNKNGGFEIQRVNNAILQIDGIDGNDGQVLELSLSSFPIPKFELGQIEVGYGNSVRKFVGKPTFTDLSCVYNDYCDKGNAKILVRWAYTGYDPRTEVAGHAVDYKKSGVVTEYSPKGEMLRDYNLYGVWLSSYDPGDADLEGEGGQKLNITLTIDKAVAVFDKWLG